MSGTILVVDDSPDIREFLADYVLRPAGYQVLTADTGTEGLSTAREQTPDLIIADNHMPGMTGLSLLRALNNAQLYIPFILMTGEGSEQVATEAMRTGASGYILKPFEPEQILSSIEQSLALVRMQRQHASALETLKQTDEDIKDHLSQLKVLEYIGRLISISTDLDAVLSEVVAAAVALINAEEGTLLLLDRDSNELFIRAAKNFDDEFVRTFRLPANDSLAGQVLRTGKPFLLDQDTPLKIKSAYLVHSLVYVPLVVRKQAIGVLGVDNRKQRRIFTQDDIVLLQVLADYAAMAIENARLFRRTEDAHKRLDALLKQIDDGIIVVDDTQRLVLLNDSARDTFGLNGQRVIGQKLQTVVNNADVEALFSAASLEDAHWHGEIALNDGRTLNAHVTVVDDVGQAVIMQDITHLKQLDRVKSEFVHAVSHDLRSPLTALLGYVDLLTRSGPITPKQEEYVEKVKFSVQTISILINDLLDLGKIEQGLDSKKEDCDLGLLCQYVIKGVAGNLEAKRQALQVSLPEGEIPIYGNPTRLRQMIANLVDNAVKYTPEEGCITLDLKRIDDQYCLTVIDTGLGIPLADQPQIFEKFFRSESVANEAPGSGLGLAIVKSIIEDHEGRITVDSQQGQGTKISVLLPAPLLE